MGFFTSLFQGSGVTVADAHREMTEDGAFVLDVRERDEYRAGHVPGSMRISLGQLGSQLAKVPKDRRVLVICRSGSRSARAVGMLTGAGYDAVNVSGGMNAWYRERLPMEPKSGRVA